MQNWCCTKTSLVMKNMPAHAERLSMLSIAVAQSLTDAAVVRPLAYSSIWYVMMKGGGHMLPTPSWCCLLSLCVCPIAALHTPYPAAEAP